jgi:hypothetical protein
MIKTFCSETRTLLNLAIFRSRLADVSGALDLLVRCSATRTNFCKRKIVSFKRIDGITVYAYDPKRLTPMYDGPERRDQHRLFAHQPVTLTAFFGGESNSFRGTLVDASRSSLGIVVDSAVAVGTVLEVRASGGVVYGVVQHCGIAPGGGFRIGVAVEEGLSGEWLRGC